MILQISKDICVYRSAQYTLRNSRAKNDILQLIAWIKQHTFVPLKIKLKLI